MWLVPWFKGVGGYTACVKVGGRWHWVGNTLKALEQMHADAKAADVVLNLVPMPGAVEALYRRHGCTAAALKNNLPQYRGFEMEV